MPMFVYFYFQHTSYMIWQLVFLFDIQYHRGTQKKCVNVFFYKPYAITLHFYLGY